MVSRKGQYSGMQRRVPRKLFGSYQRAIPDAGPGQLLARSGRPPRGASAVRAGGAGASRQAWRLAPAGCCLQASVRKLSPASARQQVSVRVMAPAVGAVCGSGREAWKAAGEVADRSGRGASKRARRGGGKLTRTGFWPRRSRSGRLLVKPGKLRRKVRTVWMQGRRWRASTAVGSRRHASGSRRSQVHVCGLTAARSWSRRSRFPCTAAGIGRPGG